MAVKFAVPSFFDALVATNLIIFVAFTVAELLTIRTSSSSAAPTPPRSLMISDPESILNVSFPAPPVMVSLSFPPVIISFPNPPTSISSPAAPVIISLPFPPVN